MVERISRAFTRMSAVVHFRVVAATMAVAGVVFGAMPALASATPTETETKLEELSSKISTEGVKLILIVLTALVALIAAVIIIPKAIGFIRRFV